MLKGLSDPHWRRFGGGRGAQNDVEGQEAVVVQEGKNTGQCPELEDVKSEQRYSSGRNKIFYCRKVQPLISRVCDELTFYPCSCGISTRMPFGRTLQRDEDIASYSRTTPLGQSMQLQLRMTLVLRRNGCVRHQENGADYLTY
jgi:hypothetical protein